MRVSVTFWIGELKPTWRYKSCLNECTSDFAPTELRNAPTTIWR